MALLDINRNPSQSELRTFGRLLPVFGALASGSLWWRSDSWRTAATVAGASAAATLLFFVVPRLQKSIFLAWIYAVYPIGWTVSHMVMAVIYFMVITPIGVAVRWFRGDPLTRRFEPTAKSYWYRRPASLDHETYLREF